jgi:hypothetical protein
MKSTVYHTNKNGVIQGIQKMKKSDIYTVFLLLGFLMGSSFCVGFIYGIIVGLASR